MYQEISYFILSLIVVGRSETVKVVTRKGEIVGQKMDGYTAFFGIPYARVDDNNHFGESLQYPRFNTPFIANDTLTKCPQAWPLNVGGTIQCLCLNIYMPKTDKTKLPILVWFHGGGFVWGSANKYGGEHLVKHGIIVVTVNYRLGPYGFFCLDDPTVPGNQGLKDQISALKWIKQNINGFGGDAKKVTIAGASYGGGAVDLHLYSSYKRLFDKVIIQSGSMFSEGFFVKPNYVAAIKIANYLGHNVSITRDALKLLNKENPIDVMHAAMDLNLKLTACAEKRYKGVENFVFADPFHLNTTERLESTSIIIGYNSKEAFDVFVNKTKLFYNLIGNEFYNRITKNFHLEESEAIAVSDIVRNFYLGDKNIGPDAMLELSDFTSDIMINRAAEWSVNKYVDAGATVYKYLFSYIGGSEYQNISGAGAIHTEELKYLFETDTKLETDKQMFIRDRMTTMWAQFVKFGNPTTDLTNLVPIIWEPVSGIDRPYLDIDLELNMDNFVYSERMAFWELFWQYYIELSAASAY